ncbi:MAG TPA: substrate-binding domain-containing protein [Oceanipulchritudo sp.]|nr:substrate-binding domain-containing protein [Oceanipulchritudo sp.]
MDTFPNDNPTTTVVVKPNRRDRACEAIKHYIRSHRLPPGELLPPVRAISEHFEVSRDAAWRALRELETEGWVRARANRRYEISEEVYSRILRSIKVKVLFTGRNYIHFTGNRRLADALRRECAYHNIELSISLLPMNAKPDPSVWEDCEILMIDSGSSREVLTHCPEFKVPVIGLDAEYSDRYHLNIVTDHNLGGRMVAERLIQKGSNRVRIVHFEKSPARIHARIEGFRQVWLESGKEESHLMVRTIPWTANNFEVALNVQRELQDFDGDSDFFITDGKLAVTYLDMLDHLKFSVPEKIRLVGYDSSQMGGLTTPPMTTIQQDMDRIAEMAVARLPEVARPHEGLTELVRIPPILVERISG